MKLAIGSVQFGMHYGISNQAGQVGYDEVARILDSAHKVGVDVIDTAIDYQESEAVLGRYKGLSNFHIVDKLPRYDVTCSHLNISDWVDEQVAGSLRRLQSDHLYGLLLHHADDLFAPFSQQLFDAMILLKERNLVKKIGVSVYDEVTAFKIIEHYDIDLIQLPFNIFDQRALHSGLLSQLAKMNIEVHTRSTFLQGLLLDKKVQNQQQFVNFKQQFTSYNDYLKQHNLTAIEASLGFVKSIAEIDRIVLGTCSVEQFGESVTAYNNAAVDFEDFFCFAEDDSRLIDPRVWGK